MSKLMKSVVVNIHKGVTKTIDHGISLVLMEENKKGWWKVKILFV